jgi:SAM-dependent methyltransferase
MSFGSHGLRFPCAISTARDGMDDNAYGHPEIVRDYAGREGLFPAEVAVLGEAWKAARGDILDIGVGAGRTTSFLRGIGRSYRAIDIAPGMVEACRRLHPGVQVGVGDARRLDGIDDDSCDLAMFSFNGIDYVDVNERAQVFAAVMRVLRPGGAFAYSSHNLRILGGAYPPLSMPRLRWSANPLRLAVRAARLLSARRRRLANRQRLESAQSMSASHAVVNDEDYDFSHLTVYVDPVHEQQALADAGFSSVLALDAAGRRGTGVLTDPWIHYLAWKPG